jgi:DNA-binding MurR/RpiR family transcriptional regulator
MNDKGTLVTNDLSQVVRVHFEQLTKSEKRIARYLLRNLDEVAFMSAAELSDRLRLSEATVVRFARSLEFSGFPELRATCQSSFRERVTHASRLRGKLDELRQGGDIFEQLTVSEIDYLTQALQTVDRQAIELAVTLLRNQNRIFVFGLGPSISLVDLLTIRLTRVGRQVISLTASGREVIEPLILLNKDDLLFAIGFFDVTPALKLVLEHAQNVGAPSILLTDTLGSLLGDRANVVLSARRGPVSSFHSLTVPMTILNTLLLALAEADRDRAVANLDKLDEIREKLHNIVVNE